MIPIEFNQPPAIVRPASQFPDIYHQWPDLVYPDQNTIPMPERNQLDQESGLEMTITYKDPFQPPKLEGTIGTVTGLIERPNQDNNGEIFVTVQNQDETTDRFVGNILYSVTGEGKNRQWQEILSWPMEEMSFLENMVVAHDGSIFIKRSHDLFRDAPQDVSTHIDIIKPDGSTMTTDPFDFWFNQSAMTADINEGVIVAGPEKIGAEDSKTTVYRVESNGKRKLLAEIPGYTPIANIFQTKENIVVMTTRHDSIIIFDPYIENPLTEISFPDADNTIFIPQTQQLVRVQPQDEGFSIDTFNFDVYTKLLQPQSSLLLSYPPMPPEFQDDPIHDLWIDDGNYLYQDGVVSLSARLGWSIREQHVFYAFPVHLTIGLSDDQKSFVAQYNGLELPWGTSSVFTFSRGEKNDAYVSNGWDIYPFTADLIKPTPTPEPQTPKPKKNKIYLPATLSTG